MKTYCKPIAFFVFAMISGAASFASQITISQEPLCIARPERSLLDHPEDINFPLQHANARARFSTCTGVGWLKDDNYLLSANRVDSSFQFYSFNNGSPKPVKYVKDKSLNILRPENIAFSKDSNFMVAGNTKGVIQFFSLNAAELEINPIATIQDSPATVHGVRFSSDFKYFACVSLSEGQIRIYRIKTTPEGLEFTLTHSVKNKLLPLRPKAIDFSPDCKFIAINYSRLASQTKVSRKDSGALEVYRFNAERGKLGKKPVCRIGSKSGLSTPEDIRFFPDGSCILVTNQGNDTVTLHDFDKTSGKITQSAAVLKNPTSQLNFPHGLAISNNGKYLAVTNYGDDKVSIYSITKN